MNVILAISCIFIFVFAFKPIIFSHFFCYFSCYCSMVVITAETTWTCSFRRPCFSIVMWRSLAGHRWSPPNSRLVDISHPSNVRFNFSVSLSILLSTYSTHSLPRIQCNAHLNLQLRERFQLSSFSDRSFCAAGPHAWNALPSYRQQNINYRHFKQVCIERTCV